MYCVGIYRGFNKGEKQFGVCINGCYPKEIENVKIVNCTYSRDKLKALSQFGDLHFLPQDELEDLFDRLVRHELKGGE